MKQLMERMSALLAITLVLGLQPALSSAQLISDVSGTVQNSELVTISGSSFGSKDHPEPLRWHTFDNGTESEVLNEPNTEVRYDADTWCAPHYSTENMRNGTMNAMFCGEREAGAYTRQSMESGHLNPSGTKLYFSGQMWFDHGNVPDDDVQIKLYRIASDDWDTEPKIIQENTQWNCRISYRKNNCPEPPQRTVYFSDWKEYDWNYFQIVLDMGTEGNADGSAYMYSNCKLQGNSFENFKFMCSGDNRMDNPMIGMYMGNASFGMGYKARVHYDDVYVDDTWSRVELGNAPVYSDCTKREMQIPTAWSNNSVTVAVNTGTFSLGSDAYLFVIDDNNIPSVGFQVTVGDGTQGAPLPGPPGQPTINE